ncbi:MAG TPA: response regulator [Ktedonobacteraceae bacterium]|nr:response regulator [Ktedonobacteraceae bacterium]
MFGTESKAKILVVEDEAYIQQVLCVYLTYSGFEVCSASNGQEAMRIIPEFCPHLIVLDLMMQPVDGWEVLRWLRRESSEATSGIPVLVLTARTQLADQAQGYEAGAVEYMTKPTQPSLLVERIQAILSMDPEQRATRQRQRYAQKRKTLERLNASQSDEFIF